MIKRMLYMFGIALVLITIKIFIEPYLYQLETIGSLTKSQVAFVLWSFNGVISIGVAILIFRVGKGTTGIKEISMMIIINTLIDLYRVYRFPVLPLLSGVVTMFTGVFICGYAYVVKKRAIFNKRTSTFLLILGPIYLFRFPFFIDLLLAYATSGYNANNPMYTYLDWTIYINYVTILLELFVLDSLLQEREILKQIRRRMEINKSLYYSNQMKQR